VLLTASGALLRSLQKMQAVELGFDPEHVLVAGYQLPLNQYSTSAAAATFRREVVDRLSSKPGVMAVGMINAAPETGGYAKTAYTIEGLPTDTWKPKFAIFSVISEDYFRVMAVRLMEGRYFNADDRSDSQPVVIVNQSMAKHCWPGQHAVGKRMHVGGPPMKKPWATVVGVVADAKMGSRDEASSDQWYTPMEQADILYFSDKTGKLTEPAGAYITVRSALPPEQIVHTLRSTVAGIDPFLALDQVQPMTAAIANVEAPRRFNTGLVSAFALGALLLALTGIYALVAFSASLRTHEIAIRMALGAQRGRIAGLILSPAAKLALLGCTFGVLGSLGVSRIITSLLFDVSATDPIIYLAGVLVMMTTAIMASVLPARRVASLDPIVSLRST
jgi:putative ABC transport system permease protein